MTETQVSAAINAVAAALKAGLPEPTLAAKSADTFVNGYGATATEEWTINSDATADKATITEYYDSTDHTKKCEMFFEKADATKYAEYETTINGFNNVGAMGSKYPYAQITFVDPIDGVQFTAYGSQLSKAYYVKLCMYCDGLAFFTTDKIYITGSAVTETQVSAAINAVAETMKEAIGLYYLS